MTLVGTSTGARRARSRRFTLAISGVDARLSSMVSYRPVGALYDGHGVGP